MATYILTIEAENGQKALVQLYPRSQEEDKILQGAIDNKGTFSLTDNGEGMWASGEVCSKPYLETLEKEFEDE